VASFVAVGEVLAQGGDLAGVQAVGGEDMVAPSVEAVSGVGEVAVFQAWV